MRQALRVNGDSVMPRLSREEPEKYRRFAEERSHRDAHISNENARAAGQALILINGGSATALIAFLSKDHVTDNELFWVSRCLGGYAAGVCFGALMVFAMLKSLDWWNVYWRKVAFPYAGGRTDAHVRAGRWLIASNLCFLLSMACFVAASSGMAYTFASSKGWDTTKSTTPSQQAPAKP
jgi:hypothetical protein